MKKQSLTKGFAVLSAASIIVKIMSLLYIPFLLAIIGEEGNGIYAAAYMVYVFIYVIANSGVPVAISKSISELTALGNYKDAVRSFKIARSYLILIGTILSIVMFVAADPISKMIGFEKSKLAIAALSPTLLITAVVSSYRGYFQGRSNMTPTAVSQVIEQIINIVFTIVFAYLLLSKGIEEACAGGTIGTSVGALAAAVYLVYIYNRNRKHMIPHEFKDLQVKRLSYRQLARSIFKYSIPITICVGAQYAGNLVDLWNTKARLLHAGIGDVRATEMYSWLFKYQQLMNAPISIAAALAAAIFPVISSAAAVNDRMQVQQKTNYAFRLCFLIVIPSAFGLSVLSQPIFSILRYGEGSFLMFYGSVVLVFMSASQIQTSILQGAGKLYMATLFLLTGIGVKIALNYFLIGIDYINISGAIIGSVVGLSVPIVLNEMAIRKYMGVNISLVKQATKPFIASGFMGLVVWIIYKVFDMGLNFIGSSYIANALATIVSVLVGVVVYIYFMILMRGITKEDLSAMPSKARAIFPKRVLALIR